jgi:hypothetical protein
MMPPAQASLVLILVVVVTHPILGKIHMMSFITRFKK